MFRSCRLRADGYEVTALVLLDTVAPAAGVDGENQARFDDDACLDRRASRGSRS